MNNRIGNHCWYYDKEWLGGVLLAWSTDHVEYDSGPGHFPTAIIEDTKTSQVKSIPVANINFSSAQP